MVIPVKSISELEVKSEVSASDKILILDSVSEEARLASKDELKGDPWTPWTDWEDGAAATVTVGSVSTLPAWSSATVTNSWTSSAAVLNFGIPEWATWAAGADGKDWTDWKDGKDGTDWAAATITVWTTTTLPAWSSATVTNVWTSQDAILNFGIPKGDSWSWSWNVNWPASSTDWHLAVFDGATGKIIKDWWAIPTVPTKVSDLTNDSGYLTSSTWVTSVNGQTWTVTVETPNTKTFYLSSTSDLTTAQAAYDWYADGKNPIVVLSNTAYMIKYVDSEKLRFWPTSFHSNLISNSTTSVTQDILDINFSAGVVSSITTSNSWLTWNFLRTDYNYSSPYTPAYDWSPATKKYVDDLINGILKLVESDYHQPVNLGNPEEYTIKECVTTVQQLFSHPSTIIYKDLPSDDPL